MWAVKLVFGDTFTAKEMTENNEVVIFSGTKYTESGLVYTSKKHIHKVERIIAK